ncbi:MAG: LemA family protein [Bacteroidia bacterium]|nr:LemA family protein [Bacteroidia bacterium]
MKRALLIFGILALVLGGCAFMSGKSANNTMVELEQNALSSWSQVENVYQRRADLIPNLVATAQQYAEFEQSTLTNVAQARKQVSDIVVTEEVLNDPQLMEKFQESQNQLGQALSRFLSVAESYPNLKSNEQFNALMAELAGTENRISTERKRFIDATREYNTFVKKFPNNLWAGVFGYETMQTFQAQAGADKAPDVNEMFNR